MQYVNFYKTKDQYEIFVLLGAGHAVDGYEQNGHTIFFRFEDQDACEETLRLLISKKLKVYAHEIISAMQSAKSIFEKNRK